MNKSEAKKMLQDNFDYLQSMEVPEYTLYRKWSHMNTEKMKKWFYKNKSQIQKIKKDVWMPKNNSDYENLNIEVIPADDPKTLLIWRILREMTHSAVWHSSPGRMARYIIVHKQKNNILGEEHIKDKYLGMISMGSDFIGIGGRDSYIGWSQDDKLKKGMLKHTAMGSSIGATQPLGYNYLGGKLISLMVCSDVVENHWNNKYAEPLAGITTTSLYGGFSQYNRLKYWKKCKTSEGKINLEPSENVYEKIKEWYKETYPDEYESALKGSHPKTRVLGKIYKELGIKTYENNAPRGVYFCELYNNTNKFLRREDNYLGEKKFDNSVESLTNLWKEKYAKKRIDKLIKDDNISEDILYYDDIIDVEWEEVKNKYLRNVGR